MAHGRDRFDDDGPNLVGRGMRRGTSSQIGYQGRALTSILFADTMGGG
jgi:hypothetical protein